MPEKKLSRRQMLKGLGLTTAGVVLAACAPKPEPTPVPTAKPAEKPPEKPTEAPAPAEAEKIYFMTWAGIFDELVEGFNTKFAGKVECEITIVPWGGYAEKALTQLAAGTNPEVMWVQAPFFPMMAKRGVFAEMEALIARDKVDTDGLTHKAEIWGSVDGKIYGIPAHIAVPRGLMYNIGLLNAAGVDLPTNDWDMDDMDAAVKAVAKPPDVWGATPRFGNMLYQDLILSNGGSILNDDETKCVMNTPEAREAFKYSVDWLLESKVGPTPAEQELLGERVFASDKLAMTQMVVTDWDSFGAVTKDYTIDAWMVSWPTMPRGKRLATAQSHPLSMPKAISAAKMDAAWEFIKYYVWDDEGINIILKKIPHIYKFSEFAKARVKDEKQLRFMTELVELHGQTWIPELWGPAPSETQNAINEQIELMLLGDASIEEATDAMVKNIDEILADL